MLVGVVAFNVLSAMDPRDPRSVGVLLVGYFFQGMHFHSGFPVMNCAHLTLVCLGLGFFMTFFYLCIYIIRYVFF